jgi:hypothetical protein
MDRSVWLCALAALPAYGADICIHSRDLQERNIPRLSVTIKDVITGEHNTQKSDDEGRVCFMRVRPGTYDVRIASLSYFSVSLVDVAVPPAERVMLEVVLQLRRITGFAVSMDSLVVGQLPETLNKRTPRKVCYFDRGIRTCVDVSRWGEYRFFLRQGSATSVEVVDPDGNVLCRERVEAVEAGPYSLICSGK